MKPFGQWFAEQALPQAQATAELPGDVDEMLDGTYMAGCFICGNSFRLDLDREEIIRCAAKGGEWYCGGSPRCCP